MPSVKTITSIVAAKGIVTEAQARVYFWNTMETTNGGRTGDPHDYINIVSVTQDQRGFVFRYEVPVELLQRGAHIFTPTDESRKEIEDELRVPAVRPMSEYPEDAPLEIPLNIVRKEPEYKEPPEGREAHAEKLMGQVDALVARHKETVAHFNKAADTAVPLEVHEQVRPIPIKDIIVSGWNPRKAFDPDRLAELKESIREHGIIEPLLVRPKGSSRYELVVGERRLRAARELGLEHVPVTVRQLTDEQVLDIMLAENLQRVDLNPIEEAHHLKRVLEMNRDLTQTELGKRIGKSQEWVSQRLRLAEAPSGLQDEIIRRRINPSAAADLLAWKGTEHFGLMLLRVDEAIRAEVGAGGLGVTVREVREIIKGITDPDDPEVEPAGSAWFEGDDPLTPEEIADVEASLEDLKAGRSEVIPAEATDEEFMERVGGGPEPKASSQDSQGLPENEKDLPNDEELASKRDRIAKDRQDMIDRGQELHAAMNEKLGDSWTNLGHGENRSDFTGNKGVPQITDKSGQHSYWAQMVGNSNGNITIRSGPKGEHQELEAIVAEAIGCAEGDHVPISVDITRGTIVIKRRGKF